LRQVSHNIYGYSSKIHTRHPFESTPERVLRERHSFGAKVADMAEVGNVWRLRVVGALSHLA
jgi:hypothetical protein